MPMRELVTLDMSAHSVQYLSRKDKRLGKVISMIGPITYELLDSSEGYRFLIHEIIEQMMSIKAGQAIFSRLETLCNGTISPDSISQLSDEEIRGTGTSNAKVTYIRCFTDAVTSGTLSLYELENMEDKDIIRRLTSIRGIGNWTAKMYLLFVLNRQDILPYEDGAFMQSYRWLYKTGDCSSSTIISKCKKWSPYSSIAARFMYRALDNGLTKNEFHLFTKEESPWEESKKEITQ